VFLAKNKLNELHSVALSFFNSSEDSYVFAPLALHLISLLSRENNSVIRNI